MPPGPGMDGGGDFPGRSSGQRWAAGPQYSVSSAAMFSSHQAACSAPTIRVGEPSKASRSLGTSGLPDNQASYPATRTRTSAGSPSVGSERAHRSMGRRLSRVGYGTAWTARSASLIGFSTVRPMLSSMKTFRSRTISSPTPGVRIASNRARAAGGYSPRTSAAGSSP
ncbi:hypothetical protein ACGFYQ_27530 [Streptomyces sp. NPDC048258]|uniref:hypothetical protein n=1 Tax=Streptomyces sp. NPDC048258 TaxID=3365527 RepID=UPI00371501E3